MVREHLSKADDFSHQLTRFTSLTEALPNIIDKSYDVCLLDLNLPDSQGVATVEQVIAAAPELPVVVITNIKDKKLALLALRAGAHEFLIKAELGPNQIATALIMAVERHKILRTELTALANYPFPAKAPATMRLYGQGPLDCTHPIAQKEFIKIYAKIMNEAVELSPYGEQNKNHDRLADLAEKLGRLYAGPQDVVDIHTRALKELSQEAVFEKIEALAREGRLLLVQIMGYLASYYRRYCRSLPGPPTMIDAAVENDKPSAED